MGLLLLCTCEGRLNKWPLWQQLAIHAEKNNCNCWVQPVAHFWYALFWGTVQLRCGQQMVGSFVRAGELVGWQ